MARNRNNRQLRLILLSLAGVALLGSAPVFARVKAFVSIAPQAYLVRAVGGSSVDVEILVPPGQSPATYEPTPQQLARLAGADVLFTTGVAFEKRLLEKITKEFPGLRIVPTHSDITLRPIERHSDHGHSHGTLDPHVWLDPKLAAVQAQAIAAALGEMRPSETDSFGDNLENLLDRIDSVDTAIRNILAPVRGKTMYVFHPAYGYFADAYGLKQVAIETDGKEPSARQLAALIDRASRDSVEVLFVQPQFSGRQAASVGQSIGARVETLDPLAENYLSNLLEMAHKIASALAGDKEQGSVSD
ncbi:MAG: zinc ABC transporter substrate-binding protein [Candidatus Zixiibacteriota bacterium]|nr:MAG: zinc ABC transporter substrate-binding protein [candidate division Zixibacteria bacterium]